MVWLLASWLFAAELASLGSPDFAVRDKAQGRLARLPLWGHVVGRAGLRHADPEVRDRCGRLLVRRLLYLEAGVRSGDVLTALAAEALTRPGAADRRDARWWAASPDRLHSLDRTAKAMGLLYADELPAYKHPKYSDDQAGATWGVINVCRMRFRGEKIPGYGH